jgi:membrane protein YdbS with pleckstrin-like domain
MLYEALKEPLLALLKAPRDPPEPPLGSAGSVQIFKASRRYLTLKLLVHFGSIALVLGFELIGWALAPSPEATAAMSVVSALVIAVTLVLMLARYFLIRLDYDMRFYVLTDRSLRIRRGSLSIEESTYTFANVQNLTLQQGPLERLLGITHLHIETAGGGAANGSGDSGDGIHHKGRLEGIEPETATQLRDQILALVTRYGDSGLGERAASGSVANPRSRETRAQSEVLAEIVGELRQINREVRIRVDGP